MNEGEREQCHDCGVLKRSEIHRNCLTDKTNTRQMKFVHSKGERPWNGSVSVSLLFIQISWCFHVRSLFFLLLSLLSYDLHLVFPKFPKFALVILLDFIAFHIVFVACPMGSQCFPMQFFNDPVASPFLPSRSRVQSHKEHSSKIR
jgi:hypothetical protein